MNNKVIINGKEYDGTHVSLSKEGLFINGVRMMHSDDGGLTVCSNQSVKKKRPKIAVNWKSLKIFPWEVLKLIFSIYIIYIFADPHNHTDCMLTGFIGFMWYVLFIKGDYGEKK